WPARPGSSRATRSASIWGRSGRSRSASRPDSRPCDAAAGAMRGAQSGRCRRGSRSNVRSAILVRDQPSPPAPIVNSLAKFIFPHFSTTLALVAAIGEWGVWCWFRGAPPAPLTHGLVFLGLLALNRVAAEGCRYETTARTVFARAGAVLVGVGFITAGGTSALAVAAGMWAVLGWILDQPTPAGAAAGAGRRAA